MTSIYQMRDLGGIEAFVLADDYDAANEMFGNYLRTHGGDPDAILYRELAIKHLQASTVGPIREALTIGRAGVVSCDAENRWSIAIPLGGDAASHDT